MTLSRLWEWTCSCILLAIGFHILIVPGAVEDSRVASVSYADYPYVVALIYLVVGSLRILGLYFQTRYIQLCFYLRASGAFISGVNWLQFATALFVVSYELNIHLSIAVWAYIGLAAADWISIYRAHTDAKLLNRIVTSK